MFMKKMIQGIKYQYIEFFIEELTKVVLNVYKFLIFSFKTKILKIYFY